MPELPEVETIRRGLASRLTGARIDKVVLRRADLRVPITEGFTEKVAGRRIEAIRRRAKYLLLHLEDRQVILAHLGMSGRLLLRPQSGCHAAFIAASPSQHQKTPQQVRGDNRIEKHDHVLFHFDHGEELVFHDPRRFGMLLLSDEDALAEHPSLHHLGPDPLSDAFTPDILRRTLAKRKGPIKLALMDQKLISGLGNIYVCEALFYTGIHPQTPAHACQPDAALLHEAIRSVLQAAIASGGSSLKDYRRESGEMGYFQHEWKVYGREKQPCYHCATPIARITQSGRSTFFCPTCQPKKP